MDKQDIMLGPGEVSQLPPYEEEWYEDSVDMNLKAFSMTEDEWVDRERENYGVRDTI